MRRAPLLAASLGLSLLSACTVGPNYVVPKTADVNLPGAQGAFLGAGDAPVKQDPVPDDWWKLYDDPTLNGLIEEALKANTDLRVASANLGRAEAVSAEVDAATEFEVSTKASAERAQLSGENYLVMKQLPTMNLGDAGVRVSYQLDLFGKLRRASEAA
ncbi:MAG: TolC family protein, partial [Caulobacteraceae bacterium]|nr:TolC family protein [Caulobacteraceae bacterium]